MDKKLETPNRPKIRTKPEIVFKIPNFNLFGVMYRLFKNYKKSINWYSTLVYYIIFTTIHLMGGCTWYRFLGISGIFFIITLFVWVLYKFENKLEKQNLDRSNENSTITKPFEGGLSAKNIYKYYLKQTGNKYKAKLLIYNLINKFDELIEKDKMNKQDNISLGWWNTLKYDVRNKLSQKYFQKSEPISLSEIKDIWIKEKDNVDYWTDPKTIT